VKRSRVPVGPDPAFAQIDIHDRIAFPDAHNVSGDQPALWGANLSPGVLLSAYEQGFFPWYAEGEPLWWWSPDPRFVLFLEELHVSTSMRKVLRQQRFDIRFDTAFPEVMHGCSTAPRHGQNGTWITSDMINAYVYLHKQGYAHSAEAWQNGELVGGCYGVAVGNMFFGESMFAKVPDASKAAFLTLARNLKEWGVPLVDSQVHTNHLESLGAREIPRAAYLDILNVQKEGQTLYGQWKDRQKPLAW